MIIMIIIILLITIVRGNWSAGFLDYILPQAPGGFRRCSAGTPIGRGAWEREILLVLMSSVIIIIIIIIIISIVIIVIIIIISIVIIVVIIIIISSSSSSRFPQAHQGLVDAFMRASSIGGNLYFQRIT